MTRVALVAFVALAGFPSSASAQSMPLGQALVFNIPDLKPDADLAAFERYVASAVAPGWNRALPGMTLHLVRADRGSRKGQYMLVWTVDTLARWTAHAAAPGRSPFTPELRAKAGDFRAGFAPFVNSGGQYHEYHLVAPETAGPLPDVEVLGIHYAKVRPEREEGFERFVRSTLHPAVANLRPDLRLLYYKSVRGAEPGGYILVFALTKASRDKYWPGGADSAELRAAFAPEIRALTSDLSSYLIDASYAADPKLAAAVFESRDWTDFVVVDPAPSSPSPAEDRRP